MTETFRHDTGTVGNRLRQRTEGRRGGSAGKEAEGPRGPPIEGVGPVFTSKRERLAEAGYVYRSTEPALQFVRKRVHGGVLSMNQTESGVSAYGLCPRQELLAPRVGGIAA